MKNAVDPHLARQLRADGHAQAAARGVDAVVAASWQRILTYIAGAEWHNRHWLPDVVRAELNQLIVIVPQVYRRQLFALAAWGHATAARTISAAARRQPVKEDRDDDQFGRTEPSFGSGVFDRFDPREFGFKKAKGRTLDDFAGYDYSRYLVAPPSAEELASIVGNVPAALTRLGADQAASTVWSGIANGFNRTEIAKALQPMLNNYAVAARRTARTEGLRVATETNLAVAEQLGTDVIGYQIHAVLDDRTRPEHRKRDGTIYYREPTSGQHAMGEMPRPPMDPDGSLAFNCRCFLSPVFAD